MSLYKKYYWQDLGSSRSRDFRNRDGFSSTNDRLAGFLRETQTDAPIVADLEASRIDAVDARVATKAVLQVGASWDESGGYRFDILKNISGVSVLYLANRDRPRKHAHNNRQEKYQNRSLKGHGDRQSRGIAGHVIEAQRKEKTGNVS